MRDLKILTACIAVLTVLAVGTVLSAAQNVFLPLMIAWILSYLLTPAVRFVTTRLKIPVELTTIVALAGLLWLATLAGGFLSQRLGGFVDAFPVYFDRLTGIAKDLSDRLGVSGDFLKSVDWGGQLRSYLFSLSGSIVTITSKTVMVIVFLLFILIGSPYAEYKVRKAFPTNSTQVLNILDSISSQIGRFLSVMTLISAATGLCVWMALSMIGVDFASTWGLLAFVLNYIPTVGSIVASIPPIMVSLVQFYPSTFQPVLTVAAILVIQVTIGNIITPKVMGDNMNLSPVIILVSLLMWGWLWGVAGALLSMPIAGIIKIVCDNVDSLRMLSVLMSAGKSFQKEFEGESR